MLLLIANNSMRINYLKKHRELQCKFEPRNASNEKKKKSKKHVFLLISGQKGESRVASGVSSLVESGFQQFSIGFSEDGKPSSCLHLSL